MTVNIYYALTFGRRNYPHYLPWGCSHTSACTPLKAAFGQSCLCQQCDPTDEISESRYPMHTGRVFLQANPCSWSNNFSSTPCRDPLTVFVVSIFTNFSFKLFPNYHLIQMWFNYYLVNASVDFVFYNRHQGKH